MRNETATKAGMNRGVVIVATLVLAFAVAASVVGIASAASVKTVKGCKMVKSGNLRVVSGPAKCKANERPMVLNKVGPRGPAGAKGAPGRRGIPGENGRTLLSGAGAPANQGGVGDFYIDTSKDEIYGSKTQSGWGQPTSLVGSRGSAGADGIDGADGEDGADGANGANGVDGANGADGLNGSAGEDGNTILSGDGPPAGGLGRSGDYYIDGSNSEIYGPKSQEGWGMAQSLIGPQGSPGTQGDKGEPGAKGDPGQDGAAGTDGADGNTILSGDGPPTVVSGREGDFFIDAAANEIYGPKTASGWGSPTPLLGPEGPQGEKGLNWRGAWDSAETYAANDAVSHDGSSWLAKRENTGATPAAGDDWTLLAEKGQPGAAGSSDGTPANTPDTDVRRDANGGFQAGAVGLNGKLTQNSNDGLVASGAFGQGSIPAEGEGARMMWYPGKAAFRAGGVDRTQWNDANVGNYSTAMGQNTQASGVGAVAMGNFPRATGEGSIALGTSAEATGEDATAIGPSSRSRGLGSTVIGLGGYAGPTPVFNQGNGDVSLYRDEAGNDVIGPPTTGHFTTAIGLQSTATGNFAVAIGKDADTNGKSGSVVISDGSGTFRDDKTVATANNQIAMRGAGGYKLYTAKNLSSGVELAPGGGSWASISDRNKKENFRPVDGSAILAGVTDLPITNWNYIGADPDRRYIGPTAQDFQAAFGLGEDTTITTQDMDGVTLAAVQELGKENEKLQEENESLRDEQEETEKRQDELDRRLAALEAELRE